MNSFIEVFSLRSPPNSIWKYLEENILYGFNLNI